VLLQQTKTISVNGQQIKVFSLDGGRTWVSKPHDLTEFRHRQAEDKFWLKHRFSEKLALPVASTDFDFWER
jgi:hypothetical protein